MLKLLNQLKLLYTFAYEEVPKLLTLAGIVSGRMLTGCIYEFSSL